MRKTAVLCIVKTDFHDHQVYRIKLEELRRLAEACSYTVVDSVTQVRARPTVNYMFGRGKLQQLKDLVEEKNVSTVIFYNVLTGKQKFNLESFLRCRVIDRYELTLEIFDSMASDEVSKLQIEIARLTKSFTYDKIVLATRYRIGREHPSFRSRGEYIYRNQLNNLRRRLARLREKMGKYLEMQKAQLEKRKKLGIPSVCIAGYYNAGKTTLFNALTGLRKPVSPHPFTTLSSKYYLARGLKTDFFLVDTIGFVYDLDPAMIESFKLTLNDIVESDLTLLTADFSDPEEILRLRLETVSGILEDTLGVDEKRIVLALNKIDKVDLLEASSKLKAVAHLLRRYPYVLVSAKKGYNLEYLLQLVESKLIEARLAGGRFKPSRQPEPAALHRPA